MVTIATLQTDYVDRYLGRDDNGTRPWTDDEVQDHIQSALDRLWPELGLRMSGDVATDQTTNTYTLPSGMLRITRIDLIDSTGLYRDRITSFRVLMDDDSPASFIVQPLLPTGFTMRVLGWKAFARTGSDLHVRLESVVAAHAAALCWTQLAGDLLNTERHQNRDVGRAISYQDAAQQAAYWMGLYREGIANDPARVRVGQVRASR